MCAPLAIGVGLMAVGMGVSAYSAYKGAKANNAAAEYNAQLLERNADISELQIKDARERGRTNLRDLKMSEDKIVGSQRASFGASGAVVDQGSTMDVVADSRYLGELDAMTLERNTKREEEGYAREAENYRSQAQLSRMGKQSPGKAAGIALLSGAAGAGSSLLLNRAKRG